MRSATISKQTRVFTSG